MIGYDNSAVSQGMVLQFLQVENNPHSNNFNGAIWNVRIWDRIVPADEMLAIFEAERDLLGV